MLETLLAIILFPFALGAIVASGALVVGVIECFKRKK